jgi:hypothetical protein
MAKVSSGMGRPNTLMLPLSASAQPQAHAKGGGFACAIGANHAQAFTGLQFERQVVHHQGVAKAFGQVLQMQLGLGHVEKATRDCACTQVSIVPCMPSDILLPLGPVAQSVEQRIENPCVGGSIPPQATSFIFL